MSTKYIMKPENVLSAAEPLLEQGWLEGACIGGWRRFIAADHASTRGAVTPATALREWSGFFFRHMGHAAGGGGEPSGSGRWRRAMISVPCKVPWGENSFWACPEAPALLGPLFTAVQRGLFAAVRRPWPAAPRVGLESVTQLQVAWVGFSGLIAECRPWLVEHAAGGIASFEKFAGDPLAFGRLFGASQVQAMGGTVAEAGVVRSAQALSQGRAWPVEDVSGAWERAGVDILVRRSSDEPPVPISIKSGRAFGRGTAAMEHGRGRVTASVFMEAPGMEEWIKFGQEASMESPALWLAGQRFRERTEDGRWREGTGFLETLG